MSHRKHQCKLKPPAGANKNPCTLCLSKYQIPSHCPKAHLRIINKLFIAETGDFLLIVQRVSFWSFSLGVPICHQQQTKKIFSIFLWLRCSCCGWNLISFFCLCFQMRLIDSKFVSHAFVNWFDRIKHRVRRTALTDARHITPFIVNRWRGRSQHGSRRYFHQPLVTQGHKTLSIIGLGRRMMKMKLSKCNGVSLSSPIPRPQDKNKFDKNKINVCVCIQHTVLSHFKGEWGWKPKIYVSVSCEKFLRAKFIYSAAINKSPRRKSEHKNLQARWVRVRFFPDWKWFAWNIYLEELISASSWYSRSVRQTLCNEVPATSSTATADSR